MRRTPFALALLVLALAASPAFAQNTTITLGRFFGACDVPGVSIADAVGEPCIIQAIIDDYSAPTTASPSRRCRPTGATTTTRSRRATPPATRPACT